MRNNRLYHAGLNDGRAGEPPRYSSRSYSKGYNRAVRERSLAWLFAIGATGFTAWVIVDTILS